MRKEILHETRESTLRVCLLQALKTASQRPGPIDRDTLVRDTFVLLAPELGITPEVAGREADSRRELYDKFEIDKQEGVHLAGSGEHPDVVRIEAAIWDLVVRGIVYPRFGEALHGRGIPWKIKWLVVTPRGMRLLGSEQPHPAHEDFVARVVDGCSDLPPEVAARLEDAHDCFNQGLYRASVVMLRLAYEHMIRAIYDDHGIEKLVPANLKPRKMPVASVFLDGIVHVVEQAPDAPKGTAKMALDIANLVRQLGNAAAHDWTRDFADPAEIEDLLILAGRNVRRLWGIKAHLS